MKIPTISRTGLIMAERIAAIIALVVGVVLFSFMGPNATSSAPGVKTPTVNPHLAPPVSEKRSFEPVPSVVSEKATPVAEAPQMVFGREGDAARAVCEVERAAGANHSALATRKVGDALWSCLLVDAAERYVDLDQGWTLEAFPSLKEQGFTEPPAPYGRTMSIFKSLAKSSMGYNRARGDRMIVVVCPKDTWTKLRLAWPATRLDGQ